MNRFDFCAELSRQSRVASARAIPGSIYADGSIQGIRAELRYSWGEVTIRIEDLPFAEKHGWCRTTTAVLAGHVMVNRSERPSAC